MSRSNNPQSVTNTGLLALAVQSVTHYSDRLFSFRVARPASLRFQSGDFLMIGLPAGGATGNKPVMRAYSIASPSWADYLEFLSIKVPGGKLTERLQHIGEGDELLVRPRPAGSLHVDSLIASRRLFMLATGTGVAPFASIIRDPATYGHFDRVVLVQSCRRVVELEYLLSMQRQMLAHADLKELVGDALHVVTTATREPYRLSQRGSDLFRTGALTRMLDQPAFDPLRDRVMICGSMAMNLDLRSFCLEHDMTEGASNRPGQFVLERAFVD